LLGSDKSSRNVNHSESISRYATPKILGAGILIPLGLIALFLVFQSNEGDLASQTESMITESKSAEMVEVIPTITPTSPPTPDKSPTPSETVNLDNTRVVGNLIFYYYGYQEYGYVDFTLFSDDIETKLERAGFLSIEDEMISDSFDVSIDRWNQLQSLIPSLVSVEVDSGSGFSKWEKQSILCSDEVIRECRLNLVDFAKKLFKNYKSKFVVSIKYNISNEEQLKDAGMFISNGSIDTITFEPATCLNIYDKSTKPPKGFEHISSGDTDWKKDIYKSLIASGDC
jgi:hypothetical protein